ncbi:MAG: hypothetical protein ACK5BB_12755 [Burkholderiaceae bacterium]
MRIETWPAVELIEATETLSALESGDAINKPWDAFDAERVLGDGA